MPVILGIAAPRLGKGVLVIAPVSADIANAVVFGIHVRAHVGFFVGMLAGSGIPVRIGVKGPRVRIGMGMCLGLAALIASNECKRQGKASASK
jgi:hypothetical protein